MKFLIVRLGALGDIVHTLPMAAALRERFPAARIDWLVDARYAAVLELVRGIDGRVVVGDRGGGGWLRLVRSLRAEGYEAALDPQGLLKSAALARASGARRVIGFERPWLREPAAAHFYRERLEGPRGGHVVDKNLALLQALGIGSRARVFPLAEGDAAAVETLRQQHPAARDGFALLNPGAAWPNKRWPADRFGRLACWLRERHGLASAVLWGPGEEGLARQVAESSAGAALLAPATRLPGLLALCRWARLLVSGDTGPLHLAAAAGTRVVALFGPTDPERNGPWDPADVTLSRYDRCECRYKRRCGRGRACIEEITVDEVRAACDRRLAS